jgi:hypothetical protein
VLRKLQINLIVGTHLGLSVQNQNQYLDVYAKFLGQFHDQCLAPAVCLPSDYFDTTSENRTSTAPVGMSQRCQFLLQYRKFSEPTCRSGAC